VQIYDGPRGAVWHLDLYRLKTADEIDELGLEEAMDDAVCLVEWAQRLGARAPSPRLELRLLLAPEGRIAQIAYVGGAPPEWMGQLR
jgi:tRNA threonylcarbamoyladenosine biosynthesis protein TsaE